MNDERRPLPLVADRESMRRSPVARDSLRCSPAARAAGHSPIGTASRRTSFLLLDVPLPWTEDLSSHTALAPVVAAIAAAAANGRHWRLQGIVPEPGGGSPRIVTHALPDGPFQAYERRAARLSLDELVEAAVAAVANPSTVGELSSGGESEFLVCTHGRRDRCCGAAGTALWQGVARLPGALPIGASLQRTSHTGGHRFAPTAIHLPAGTSWAWLDVDAVEAVTRHVAPFSIVADRYRGSSALATQCEQILELAALKEIGWAWLDGTRVGTTSEEDELGRRTATIDHVARNGLRTRWTAIIEVLGATPIASCGDAHDVAAKHEQILGIVPGSLHHQVLGPGEV